MEVVGSADHFLQNRACIRFVTFFVTISLTNSIRPWQW